MNDREFELRSDLARVKERAEQYTKTISELTLEVASLKEALGGIAEYAVERGAVCDLPTDPLWVIREMAIDAL
jgi:predicted  nucleic acid-binding Zn-ribbon protein